MADARPATPTGSPSPGRGCSPTGTGAVNQTGLDFYSRLVDELLARGIRPVAHALPLGPPAGAGGRRRLADRDDRGPRSPTTPRRGRGARRPGAHWTTLNEPWCSAFLGYATGVHAPGRHRAGRGAGRRAPPNLAHGLACRPLREPSPGARSLDHAQPRPVRPGAPTRRGRRGGAPRRRAAQPHLPRPDAARRVPGRRARDDTGAVTDWSFVQDGDLAIDRQPIDVLGVNYYSPAPSRRRTAPRRAAQADGPARRRRHRRGRAPTGA